MSLPNLFLDLRSVSSGERRDRERERREREHYGRTERVEVGVNF